MPFPVIWLHAGVKSQPCKLSVKVWLWKSVAALSLEHLIWLQSRLTPPRDPMPGLWNEQGICTNGFHLHVSLLPPPFHPPPSLSLFSLSLIVLHFVSTGTKGSELFDCEDGCHADQCQQPQTWHHIRLPHPTFLHASPRLVPVLPPTLLCLLFYFFVLHFLLVLSVVLLVASAHRLRSVQRPPGVADTRRMWVLVSHLQPPKIQGGGFIQACSQFLDTCCSNVKRVQMSLLLHRSNWS